MSETTELIKRLRASGMSQSEISRRTGIPQPRLSRWEGGEVPDAADDSLKLQALVAALDGPAPAEEPAKPLPKPKAEHPEPAPQAASEQEHTDSTTHRRGEDTNDDPFKARNTAQANELAKALGMQQRESDKPSRERGGR